MSQAIVGIVKCGSYSRPQVQVAVNRLIELLGGAGSLFSDSDKVLIKPNMLSPNHPSKAVTTHPEIVRSVIQLLDLLHGSWLLAMAQGEEVLTM